VRILIIGCGSIGSVLAKAVHDMPEVDRIYVTDQSKDYAVHLIESLDKAEYVDNVNDNLSRVLGEVNLAVEAASQEAARKYVPFVLENGVDVMVMSVGVFADDEFRERCFTLAKKHRSRLYVPSGAICGTDGLHSAAAAKTPTLMTMTSTPFSRTNGMYFRAASWLAASTARLTSPSTRDRLPLVWSTYSAFSRLSIRWTA
jgi:aspartate dehydrogenase